MRSLTVALILLSVSSLPVTTRAGWPAGGGPVCTAVGEQSTPAIAPDGSGGAIVTWFDHRSGTSYDIYAQRISAAGGLMWTAGGVAICTATSDQNYPTIVADGAGGAVVAWSDYRNGSAADIYAQRVNAVGVVQWTANGVAICTAADEQVGTPIAPDGAGGAIITWHDYRSGTGYTDIYAQRVNAAGAVQWTADGVPICTAANHQTLPVIDTDGAGGAIIAWQDSRNPTYDIYAQRVDAAGAPQWTADGVVVSAGSGGQIAPIMAADGAGGAIVAWGDGRNGPGPDLYAQRISALGNPVWTANGVAVANAAGFQSPNTMVSDGANGAIITWYDSRGTSLNIYVQRVSNLGVPQWTANGVAVCTATGDQYFPQIASDGAAGAIVTWSDYRGATILEIYAQRVNAAGAPQWLANGLLLSSASDAGSPVIVPDNAGGAIVAWTDYRNADTDIYASRMDASGSSPTGVAGPAHGPSMTVTDIYPNPFSGTASFDIGLAAPTAARIDVFDVAGRRVRTMLVSDARSRHVEFDGRDGAGRLLPSGVYFYRVSAAGETIARKMVIAR